MRNQLQRALAALLLCAVLTGTLAVPASAASGFRDVPRGHWAEESISRCVDLGFFKGQSAARFGLRQEMTRAAVAVVLCRFFGWETAPSGSTVYKDVPANAWYAGAVESAFRHGAITEQRDLFRPSDPITREELSVMLVRALGYGTIAGLWQEMPLPFRDVTTNRGYIAMAYELGLAAGTSADTFSPDKTAPREQVAVILMRLYDKLHGKDPAGMAVITDPADAKGLAYAAIPAARVFSLSVRTVMEDGETAPIIRAAHENGGKALLLAEGGSSALTCDPIGMAQALAEEVRRGGYDGLLLDIPEQGSSKRRAMNLLAAALGRELGGEKLFCLVVEGPTLAGREYDGYDYAYLSEHADKLVVRPGSWQKDTGRFTDAPVHPLEEVYCALAAVTEDTDPKDLLLVVDTGFSAWQEGEELTLTPELLEELWKSPRKETYYSDRYGCAYFIAPDSTGKPVTVWYLDEQGLSARVRFARLFGIEGICLVERESYEQLAK